MKYVITATDHGLNQIPCNINATLFGEFWSGDAHSEESRPFDTLGEALEALRILENEGDWPDGRPEYEIKQVTA